VNTGPDIAAAVNKVLAELGRETHSVDRILDWVGEGAARLVERALAGGGDRRPPAAELERALALFYRHYAAAVCVHSEPYPHLRPLLRELCAADVRVGCVTNKPERLSRALLDALELASMFDVVVGGDTLASRKPDPEPIWHACRQLGVAPEYTVYVGDSMTDCNAATAAGVQMVAVSYGYNRGVDLTQARCAAMIDSLDALPDTLAGLGDTDPSQIS
jgi:phosphoglycolate phosphatase